MLVTYLFFFFCCFPFDQSEISISFVHANCVQTFANIASSCVASCAKLWQLFSTAAEPVRNRLVPVCHIGTIYSELIVSKWTSNIVGRNSLLCWICCTLNKLLCLKKRCFNFAPHQPHTYTHATHQITATCNNKTTHNPAVQHTRNMVFGARFWRALWLLHFSKQCSDDDHRGGGRRLLRWVTLSSIEMCWKKRPRQSHDCCHKIWKLLNHSLCR